MNGTDFSYVKSKARESYGHFSYNCKLQYKRRYATMS